MTTVSSYYDTVVLGVSQQIPGKRRSGQHWAQDNFLSDPVRGLRRRPGSRRLSETAAPGNAVDLGANFRTFDMLADDRYITLLCRVPGSTGTSAPVYAFQRGAYGAVADAALIPVQLTAGATSLLANGINSVAAVGDYLALAHTAQVTSTRTEYYDTNANKRRAVIAVKAGTFSRKYTAKFKRIGGPAVSATYTVPNLYNADGSINSSAATASQPNNIAEQLRAGLAASGDSANFTVTRRGSSLLIASNATDLEYVEATDDGDNSQIKATWRVVQDAADLPPTAALGHVVQVKPVSQDEVYYLRAEADSAEPEKVVWREFTAATISIVSPFCVGRIYNNTLHIGSSPTDIQSALTTAGSTETVPQLAARVVGDDDSCPAPHFVGKVVTELRVFQERLLVCSGPVVTASRVSSFFNFWRTTVLTYPDDDAVELYSTGSEADTIRASIIFDRSIVFFGDQQQYAISGKVPLTGATATIMQSSAHKDATKVRPVTLGDYLFFFKFGRAHGTAHQVAVGSVEDTSNSMEVSRQLYDYLSGDGAEAVALSVPSMLLIRPAGQNTLYTYTFMDGADKQRVYDAWSRWTFAATCGSLAGVSVYQDSPRLHFARQVGGSVKLVVDEVYVNDTDDIAPHLDSWYALGAYTPTAGEHCAYTGAASPTSAAWFGRSDTDTTALAAEFGSSANIVLGHPMTSEVKFTSPQVMTANDKQTAGGTLVVSSVAVDLERSAGMTATTELPWGEQPGITWTGRILGQLGNLVGQRSLRSDKVPVFIGQSPENYILRVTSKDWLPLTITGLEWRGQYFKRTRSV